MLSFGLDSCLSSNKTVPVTKLYVRKIITAINTVSSITVIKIQEQAIDREHERDVFQQEIQKLEQQLKVVPRFQPISEHQTREVRTLLILSTLK